MEPTDVVPGLGAVVLCGGLSSRMGRSKAELAFGSETLLQRVVRRIEHAAAPIVVVAAAGQALPTLPPGVLVVRDAEANRGPLEGLSAGLAVLRPHVGAAYVSSTDAAFVCAAVIRRLAALRAGTFDIVAPRIGGHAQPLAAIYATTLGDTIAKLLRRSQAGPYALFDEARTAFVDEEALYSEPAVTAADPQRWAFRNVNTPEDYELALRDAGLTDEAEAFARARHRWP
jgi:molybdopterin-guanine dinucleotide biosynthesis protein A